MMYNVPKYNFFCFSCSPVHYFLLDGWELIWYLYIHYLASTAYKCNWVVASLFLQVCTPFPMHQVKFCPQWLSFNPSSQKVLWILSNNFQVYFERVYIPNWFIGFWNRVGVSVCKVRENGTLNDQACSILQTSRAIHIWRREKLL